MNFTSEFSRKLAVGLGAVLLGAASLSATTPQTMVPQTTALEWQGTATLQLDLHSYGKNFNDGTPEFVSRLQPFRSLNGDDFPGFYFDLSRASLRLVDPATQRPVFGFDREAYGYFNQKNALFFDGEKARLDAFFSVYRSQQMLYPNPVDPAALTPGALTNSIFSKFNDDSFGRKDYYVDRRDYGFALALRPQMFGYTGSQMGDVELSYLRSDRSSERFFDWMPTARLVGGTTAHRVRWRGINQTVKEEVNRFGISLSGTPFGLFGVKYEMVVEKYDREFNNDTVARTAQVANVPIVPWSPAAVSTGEEKFIDLHNTEFWPLAQVTLGWVPSTMKFTNKIKFDKAIGRGLLNFGWTNVVLDQESFTAFSLDRGLKKGQIITQTGFANWTMRVTPTVTWNAHALSTVRDNRSTFPAVDPQKRLYNTTLDSSVYDYLNPRLDGGKHGGVFAPYITGIDTVKLGTDFTFLLPVASSRVVAGWTREDTSRDLVFGNPAAGLVRSIDPNEAFVRPESVSDTFYVNYSGKLKSGVKLRWNNSYVVGDEVGLMTDAKEGYKGRLSASYYWPTLWQGAGVDVFHQVRYGYNNGFRMTSFSNDLTTLLSSEKHEREQLFQSAGITFNASPSKTATAYAGYIWNRDQLDANLLYTTTRRYEANMLYRVGGREQFLSDAHTVFVGGSCQFTPKVLGTADYSLTGVDGHLGTGPVKTALGSDNAIDNVTHNFGASLTVTLQNNVTVGGRYTYARYDDSVATAFDSSYHILSVMVTKAF